jgi:hypothetical protein
MGFTAGTGLLPDGTYPEGITAQAEQAGMRSRFSPRRQRREGPVKVTHIWFATRTS